MSRLLVSILMFLVAVSAFAQSNYPNKPIRIVIGYAAGGPTDIVGRIYAAKLAENLGVPVIVDTRAGAAGIIGTDLVAKAPPDGYTLLLGVISTHGLHPASGKKIPYDAVKDFEPVALAVNVPMVIMVNPAVLPAKDVKSLIAELKANPGKHKFGSSGNGGISHMCFEMFKQRGGGLDMVHVPYKGTGPAITDLLGGHISAVCEGVGGAASHVRSGPLRGIGTATLRRAHALPDLPTIAETGLQGFEAYTWNMFFAPAKTPRHIVDRLNRQINAAATDPATRARLDGLGVEVVDDSTPASLRNFVPGEIAKWSKVFKEAGVKVD